VFEYSKNFLSDTVNVWQPDHPEILTEDDAREIADNMVNLINYLAELERKYGQKI